jgi:predicted metal-binding membrane protein
MAIHASWPAQTFWWLVMVIAMMFPLLVDHIRNTAARSLWYRRHRAVGLFLTGYVAPWLVFGIAASAMLSVLEAQSRLDPPLLSALGFGLALIWQVTPARRRAVLSCHRTRPISPTGWRADRDCLRYGSSVGASCLFSCWALMLACMLSRHSVPAMFAITAIGLFERNRARPNQRLLCAVIAALGFTYAIGPYL